MTHDFIDKNKLFGEYFSSQFQMTAAWNGVFYFTRWVIASPLGQIGRNE
jgi:hypothetical protein